jgi:hypothetical protein
MLMNYLAKSGESNFRYPTHGHVLYLQMGTQVKGPTCIFENCSSGGDLVTRTDVSLVTVPAVEGRVLRFPGDALHAVPRPTDVWLLPFVQGSPDFNPSQFERSVILFNTWQDPPLGVPQLEENQHKCLSDESTVIPRNDWIDVPCMGDCRNRGRVTTYEKYGCWGTCHGAIVPCELSICARMRNACDKHWSNQRSPPD